MIDPKVLRALIQQTLTPLGLYCADAEELLMATCANESNLGQFRTQANGGPARGIFQDEIGDFQDLFINYLDARSALYTKIAGLFQIQPPDIAELVTNDAAAIGICRAHYLRAPGALPTANDLDAIWAYYKLYYNTPGGAAVEGVFKYKYERYVLGKPL